MGSENEWRHGGAPGWVPPTSGPIPTSDHGLATPQWQPPPPSRSLQVPFAPVGLTPGPPPKKKRSKKKIAIVVGGLASLGIVGVITVVVWSVGISYFEMWNLERNVPANAQVNECYSDDGSSRPVDCSGPHHFEVYSAVVLDDESEWPGFYERWYGLAICDLDFEAYTGDSAYSLLSDYIHNVRFPDEDDWADGDRRAICVAHHDRYLEVDEMIGTPLYP